MDFIAFGITLLATLPILAWMRAVMARRIQKLMLAESKEVGALPSSLVEGDEVPAPELPKVEVVSYQAIDPEVIKTRQTIAAETARTTKAFFSLLWRRDILGSLGYLVFPFIAGLLIGQPGVASVPMFVLLVLPVVAVWAISTTRLLVKILWGRRHRATYRKPRGLRRFDLVCRSLWLILFGWFEVILHPIYGFVAFGAALAFWKWVLFEELFLTGPQLFAIALAYCVHGYLIRTAYLKPDTGQNRRLLILRVFDVDRSSFLTFDFLLDYWRHFGSSFTVIDPAYLRYQYRGVSSRNIAVTFWTLYFMQALLSILWVNFEHQLFMLLNVNTYFFLYDVFAWIERAPLMGFIFAIPFAVVAVIVGYLIAFAIIYRRAPSDFAKSSAHIARRIDTLMAAPRKSGRVFRDLHMYCYDNTWRIAVAEFVARADVVLMDLRGFSTQRKGCEYEVDFLFDTIPVDQIVFVVDAAAGEKAIDAAKLLIAERWEHLRVNSPNVELTDPVAKIFRVREQHSADVQALADHLLFASASRQTQV